MKLLMIGDVFGRVGRDMLFEQAERGFFGADLVIANAENAAHGRGVTKAVFDELCRTGVDGFTLGNHVWDCPDISNILHYNDNIIRPYNFEGKIPGSGTMILKSKSGARVGVVNLIGNVNIPNPATNPFLAADRAIESLKDKCDFIAVDFHAEATSEKQAMGYYLDGRASVIVGTHTHVQTADEQILPRGSGYISDLGMTGPAVSVLGMEKNTVIEKFVTGIPRRMEPATGSCQFSAVLFGLDDTTKKTVSAERIYIKR